MSHMQLRAGRRTFLIALALAGAWAQRIEAQAPAPTLSPARRELAFTALEGTWMQPDVSPDGRTIVFDLLGDIYALPIGGGRARPLLTGTAFETSPAFSPDGRHIAFVSDRSGVTNLWIANADGGDPRQISRETALNVMAAPAWSPDGRRLVVSRLVHSLLAFELWGFPIDGGVGERITSAQPNGNDDWSQRYNALGAAVAPDGRHVYYATKLGDTFTRRDPPVWSVVRRNLQTGTEEAVIRGGGGAMSPALSRDGRLVAYAAREGRETVLRLRDLSSGDDRSLTKLDRDGQEGGYYSGLTPRFRFGPGDREILVSRAGVLVAINIDSGRARDIPFSADVRLAVTPTKRVELAEETGPVRVRVIQGARLSPNGRTIAFTALGRLYLQDMAGGAPRRVEGAGENVFQPSWSPDGRTIAYVRWSAPMGGAIWTMPVGGGRAQRLTSVPAYYTEPVFAPDGRSVAALRANHYDRLRAPSEITPDRPTDIIRVATAGGAVTKLTPASGARLLAFAADGAMLRYYTPAGAMTVPVEGGEARIEAVILAQAPSQYVGAPVPAEEVRLNPSGTHALVRHSSQLWLVDLAPRRSGGAPTPIDLTTVPPEAIRLTRIGADFADWTAGGDAILWSAGAQVSHVALAAIDRAAPGATETSARGVLAEVRVPRDVPEGSIVLRGGTALTMRGDEVVEQADIVITGNRIVAVGARGDIPLPIGAIIHDVTGKTIIPGLVDAHAHWAQIRRQVHQVGHWNFEVNLAFGITSGLDVQPFTTDIFTYQDMIDAGMMRGLRAWSTGPGIFRNSPIDNAAEMSALLSRYRDLYRTGNIKAYMVGDRAARQRVAQAVRTAGMMATTEGASDLHLALTHYIDGFAGQEHSLPVSPLRADVIALMAAGRTSYTPVFSVLYGGGPMTDGAGDPRSLSGRSTHPAVHAS